MKILIVNPSFWIYGGGERVIVKLANYLTEHNHTCTILTTQMIPEIRKDLIETRLIFCENIQKMADWLNKIHEDFDIINYHNDPVQLLAFGKKTPSIWNCNEPPQICLDGKELPNDQKEVVKKFINKVIVADKFNQTRFRKIYDMDSEIINYGIDHKFWQKGDGKKFRKKYELADNHFVMTQVGFIHPMKNQMRTITLFKDIKHKIPEAKLVLAGYETPYKMQLEDFIFANNLQADIVFTGFVSQEELRDIYHGSDLGLFPIRSQGGWLSIFDAIACGLPVIVSSEATCSSIIKKNKIGFVENWDDNIMEIYNNKLSWELVFNSRHENWVKNNLSWDKFCEKMEKAYESCLN